MPTKSRVKRARKTKKEDNSTVMLMLGLFLILLAFFILLNAISELVEERVQAASQGVMSGFGFEKSSAQLPDQNEIDMNVVYEKVSSQIRQTMQTYMATNDFELNNGPPEKTVVTLNPLKFYQAGKWRLKSTQAPFFAALSKMLNRRTPGYHLTIDILTPNRDEKPQEQEKQQQKAQQTKPAARDAVALDSLVLGGYRATQFARALIERGVKPTRLSTGVSEEQTGRIMLVFNTVVTDKTSAKRGVQNASQQGAL